MIERLTHPDGVIQLRTSSWVSRRIGMTVSAYLIDDQLIDSAFPGAERELARVLDAQPVAGAWITHHHEDHAGNVQMLVERGVPMRIAAATAGYCRAPHALPLYRRVTWTSPRPLTGEPIELGDSRLSLLHAPGHCDDHHVVWDAGRRIVFGGDLFLGVKVRVAHPDENPAVLAQSVRMVASLGPRVLYDAHRGRVDDPVPQLLAKADWIDHTVADIQALIREGLSDAVIRDRVLGPEEWSGHMSRGEYSRLAFVRAVRAAGSGTA